MLSKHLSRLALVVLLLGMTTMIGAQAQSSNQSVLVVGIGSTFPRLNPNATTFTNVGRITINVVEPLIWENRLGEFKPWLATSWSINKDATEYTFKLRKGVTFQDGTPFNAEAVKFTFDRIVNPATKSQTALSLIGPYSGTEIINDHEVMVKFSQPYAPFLDSAASPLLGIISPTAFKRVGDKNWGVTALVGTGPYKLESFVPNSEVVLVRNPSYNSAPPAVGVTGPAKFEKIIYKIITEPTTLVASLETGETNLITEVPTIAFSSLENNPDITATSLDMPGSGWSLMMNEERNPTNELAVRRAIQLAINKKEVKATVFDGIGTVSCGPLTHSTFGFDPSVCNMFTFNLDRARQILKDAGWVDTNGDGIRERDGQPLIIKDFFINGNPIFVGLAQVEKSDLAKVGIDVELHGSNLGAYLSAVRAGKHNTQNWWEPSTDPGVLSILFASKNAGGGTNRNNYRNAEMDQLLNEAAGAADPEKRAALYSQIQKKVKNEAIMVFYNDSALLYAQEKSLHNVIFYQGGIYPYLYASELK